jgi:hypothetical protein
MVAWGDNSYGQTNVPGLTQVKLIAAGGYHSLAGIFSPLVQYNVDLTKDLLLIYNTNSADGIWVKDYYLAHRPMVGAANVLGMGCPTQETVLRIDFTNTIQQPILNWLNVNPTKRPKYWVLFLGIPSRINADTNDNCPTGLENSLSYELYSTMQNQPFVMHLNLHDTNGCRAYIDKLEKFGTNYSPGKLIISASAGDYGNTNFMLDDIRHGTGYAPFHDDFSENGSTISSATNALLAAGVAPGAILFSDGIETYSNGVASDLPHPKGATNVAGYMSWGVHSSLGSTYAISTNLLTFSGNSSWWIIETSESFNGQWTNSCSDQGTVTRWFSSSAFGGTNYSYIPVGAVSHTDEPQLGGVSIAPIYFGLWASRKNFAICAWNSRHTPYFQVVGDPFVIK